MAIPPTPKPQYPNVPQTPGVPPVLRQAGQVQSTVSLLVSDAATILSAFQAPQWGLFSPSGQPILASTSVATQIASSLIGGVSAAASLLGISGLPGGGFAPSVLDFEFRQEYRVATAQQEQGAFTSYNKVQMPFDARMTLVVGGTEAQRSAFLATAAALAASLALLSLVTPEVTYPSVNVVHYDYRRTAKNGLTLLAIDLWMQQIRVTGTAQFSSTNTGSPSGADPVNVGTVSPAKMPDGLVAQGIVPT